MITTFSGTNSYMLQKMLNKKISSFSDKYGDLAVERHDGEEASELAMSEALQSTGLFASNKLVVLRTPSANKQFSEKASELLADVDTETEVILVEPKLDKRSSYAKWLQKNTEFINCSDLDERQLVEWLMKTAREQGGHLDRSGAQYLIERVGPNQELLAHELEKLLIYSSKIDKSTIETMVEPLPRSTVFELLDAALAGNFAQAHTLYKQQRAQKVEPKEIMGMLAWQIHVLAIIKTSSGRSQADIAKEAHIHPYVVQKNSQLAQHISLSQLKQLTNRLRELDVRMKNTSLDDDEAMNALFADLATR